MKYHIVKIFKWSLHRSNGRILLVWIPRNISNTNTHLYIPSILIQHCFQYSFLSLNLIVVCSFSRCIIILIFQKLFILDLAYIWYYYEYCCYKHACSGRVNPLTSFIFWVEIIKYHVLPFFSLNCDELCSLVF